MNCLYCDKEIEDTLKSLFIKEDVLCYECRQKLRPKKRSFKIDNHKITYFFDYDSFFKTLLVQYKECYDEVLKDVFLYDLSEYLKIRYHGYEIMYAPSSKKKREERGFDHLKLIFENLNMKEAKGLHQIEEMSQLNKNLNERQKIINNFKYDGGYINKVLLVDDVYASGSTIRGILKEIEGKVKKIDIIVLSKS